VDHLLSLCPIIHYVPEKVNIIRIYAHGNPNNRAKREKKNCDLDNKKINSLLNANYFRERMDDFNEEKAQDVRAYYLKI
jgi:hypothetical protein